MSDTIKTRSVVLDCPDPRAPAEFYSEILDWPITYADDEWVVLKSSEPMRICFQQVPNYTRPTWPEGPAPQQFHLACGGDGLAPRIAGVEHEGMRVRDERVDHFLRRACDSGADNAASASKDSMSPVISIVPRSFPRLPLRVSAS